MIKFIENPIYNEANNISSALLASHLMQNAYVMEADLLLYNSRVIKKYQYSTNYLGVKVDRTDDWCFLTDSHLKIKKLGIGGIDCYHMFGVSYWDSSKVLNFQNTLKWYLIHPAAKKVILIRFRLIDI